ncbi:MAG: HisS family protein, partial [Rhizobiaceae bacterium]
GRFRQFMQFDADTVGAPNPSADAEMCMMMADTMDALGLKGQYIIRVNNRKVLDGVMEVIGLGGDENTDKRLDAMRTIDKLDRLKVEGVRALLGAKGRKDESGDFTKGVGLTEEEIDILIGFLHADLNVTGKNGKYSTKYISTTVTLNCSPQYPLDSSILFNNKLFEAGLEDLASIEYILRNSGYDSDRIKIDPSCVRGLEYYTGAVYECELTFPVTNEKGETVTFGSVAGGGRYDGLVKRFTGQDIPATGFSIGVSRLMTALKNLGKLEADTVIAPVVVCVMDRDTEALAGYQKMVQELRNAGIRAEMYQGNPKQFGKQLQYADRRGSPIAIIQGGDEREAGTVQVKDLIEGLRLSKEITDNEEWRAARPAQQTVKLTELVATVQKVLADQEAEREA